MAQISPMLAVGDAAAAIEFYKAAFGAIERWRVGDGGSLVAGLEIDGAEVFLASANPPRTAGPAEIGSTTVRIELFVDDPAAVLDHAVAAGATSRDPVVEHEHQTVEGGSFRMLQGAVGDPFGTTWLIGRFL